MSWKWVKYLHNLYPRQEYVVSSQEKLYLFLKTIRSAILTTTHLMPRRAPLRADSLPVLICCSRRQPTSTLRRDPFAICICIFFNFFFFFGHISSCSHLCLKCRMGWAQFDRRGHDAGVLGAIRAVSRAWQAFKTVLALGILKANPWLSRNIPGDWISASPIPVYAHKIWMQPGFFCS